MKRVPAWCRIVPVLLVLSGCGGSPPSPTGPSTPSSFLTGSWSGTVTIQVNPGQPAEQPPTSGPTRWTFAVVPQSNLQSFQATVRSDHPWLTMLTTATTALTPGNTAPAQISTLGQFSSPRGCTGTFVSAGTAQSTRIEADFSGTDCEQSTFRGTVVLTKE